MSSPESRFIGKKFGKLTAIEPSGRERRYVVWRCQCECGGERLVRSDRLAGGIITSCGCPDWFDGFSGGDLKRQSRNVFGQRGLPTYNTWRDMIQRCYNKNNDHYDRYGGRGITVCNEWRRFEDFVLDVGLRPPGTTLDRINPDLGYSKMNCRWATPTTQALNRAK